MTQDTKDAASHIKRGLENLVSSLHAYPMTARMANYVDAELRRLADKCHALWEKLEEGEGSE